jgi:hypothetical protein
MHFAIVMDDADKQGLILSLTDAAKYNGLALDSRSL